MIFLIRPAKNFLFSVLAKTLAQHLGEVGLDAAAANFKNRWMFKTKFYYGLDIDLEALKNGVAKYPTNDTYGILGDLTKLDRLPDNSVDVVVSTNTLDHLDFYGKVSALKNLARLTAPQGIFLCDFLLDSQFLEYLKILQSQFAKIRVIYYRNIFSRFYEGIFEKDGNLGSHPIAGLKPFRFLSYLLSRLEFLTKNFSFFNKSVILICQNKKVAEHKNHFNLVNLPLVAEKIYYILG